MTVSAGFQKGLLFLLVFFGVHILLGLYAVYFNGYFVFGATVIERYVVHLLYGSEMSFNPTGAASYHINDLCLQECDNCNSLCFPRYSLDIDCDSCLIRTPNGNVVVREDEFLRAVSDRMIVMENVTFKCYPSNKTECGFEEKLEGNYSLLHILYTSIPSKLLGKV